MIYSFGFCLFVIYFIWSSLKSSGPHTDIIDWNSKTKPEECNKFSNKIQTRKDELFS